MRACEGCRRRKIKCDAATTNTWPCGACIRLKLHCVRPNGHYDGTSSTDTTPTNYEPPRQQYDSLQLSDTFRQPVTISQHDFMSAPKSAPPNMYAGPNYHQNPAVYQQVPYAETATGQPGMHYTTMPPQVPQVPVPDQTYAQANVFHAQLQHHQQQPQPQQQPQIPLQQTTVGPESPPESYPSDQYSQGDLADLLGSLKVNEAGTGMYIESWLLICILGLYRADLSV